MIHFTVLRKFMWISQKLSVTRTRIQVTGENFDEGELNLIKVSGQLELSDLELA